MVNPLDSYILVRHFGCTRIWCPTWFLSLYCNFGTLIRMKLDLCCGLRRLVIRCWGRHLDLLIKTEGLLDDCILSVSGSLIWVQPFI